jgi:hypothetical protein
MNIVYEREDVKNQAWLQGFFDAFTKQHDFRKIKKNQQQNFRTTYTFFMWKGD